MNEETNLKNIDVVVAKDNTPKSTVLKGIEILGGISKFINEGDKVFIKFNLCLPTGFPTNTNFDVVESLITSCKQAGVDEILLGSFPLKSIPIDFISNSLDLEEYFKNFGAKFVYLDNSDLFTEKKIKKDQIENIRKRAFSFITINEKEFLVPKVIVNSDKFIIVNQVNVNPIFRLNLSLLNAYSIVPPKCQEIAENRSHDNNYISQDQYSKDLISNVLDVFTIRQPNLVINDCFFLLEGAGPLIYSDSNLKKTGLMVIGNNAVSVDLITLKLLNIDSQDSELLLNAHKRGLGIIDPNMVNLFGEDIEDNKVDVEQCISKLENIKLKNFLINSGQLCTGCFKQAYHLLNFMKTHMIKDLKYNPRNAFLVGLNPNEPERFDNVVLFGECAIRSTKNSNFRKIEIKPRKKSLDQKKLKKKDKIKVKSNKSILGLPGCPPDIFKCLKLIYEYYGKKNLPNLSYLKKLLEILSNPKSKEKLRMMGVI